MQSAPFSSSSPDSSHILDTMSHSGAFSRRLSEFKEKFGRLLGARAQGYDELSTLDQPLVGDQRDEYDRRDHHSRSDYQPPRIHGEAQEPVFHPSALPTQVGLLLGHSGYSGALQQVIGG